MATVLENLKGVNAYPIPYRTLEEVSERRGVSLSGTSSKEIMSGREYKLAKADLLLWLSLAPNITQGGQSYSFTDEQRKLFRNQAKALYDECGESEEALQKPVYGYKGSRL